MECQIQSVGLQVISHERFNRKCSSFYYNSNDCTIIVDSFTLEDGSKSFRINLDEIDHLLYSDYDSMYEVVDDNDIKVRVKLK